MMKKKFGLSLVAPAMLGASVALLAILNACSVIPQPKPQSSPPVAAVIHSRQATPPNPILLDKRRQFALGMIETGNDDREIGGLGEISRYQIMPSVWRHYSSSLRYHDPETSLEVARRHWLSLYTQFKQHARREPSDFDMYVLWNTRYTYYASRGFQPARLGPTVRDRAQRFVNLVGRGPV